VNPVGLLAEKRFSIRALSVTVGRVKARAWALVALLVAPDAFADIEPWAHDDGIPPPVRHQFGETGIEASAEYRAQGLYLNPVALSGIKHRRASWVEHRLRLDAKLDYEEQVALVLSVDALDGVLWGDNGTFGGNPSPNSGTRAAASNPNVTRPAIAYDGRGDEEDPENYGYALVAADPIKVRRLYGEIGTPIGLFRIGRQPTMEGMGLLVADGDGRRNRFGSEGAGDSTDRILFATKPLEALVPEEERDRSRERGLFLISFYDRVAQSEIRTFGDNLHGVGAGVRFLDPQPQLQSDLELGGFYAHRWESTFDTNIHIMTARALARVGKLGAGIEGVHINGATREVSEALSLINNDPVVRQDVRQWAARAVVRWDEPIWSAYLEFDFASGDRNPNPGTDLTQAYFAEDANVGLLMFERIIAFESARSSAAGVELLRRLGADTYPAERVDSEGSFTNAVAIFPQFDLRPHRNLLLRGGLLVAWAPSGVVDPLESLKQRDGREIEDDLVNFHGGKPGSFYGAELDGRLEWRYLDHFIFELEGAVLFPGDALEDENGQAARSVLVQGRSTFVF
jgi:hypothetical protein